MPPKIMPSRSGTTDPFGKCTEDIKRLPVPEAVKHGLDEYRALRGRNEAETHRELLTDGLFGVYRKLPLLGTGKQPALQTIVSSLAQLEGLSEEEYIGLVLTRHVFGALHVERMRQDCIGCEGCERGHSCQEPRHA